MKRKEEETDLTRCDSDVGQGQANNKAERGTTINPKR